MLRAWERVGIHRVDLALRRPDGAMIWQRDRSPHELPLAWARAENVRAAEVYARPARGYSWPLLFLDDVAPDDARRVACRYAALVVRSSPQGGCHVWLACTESLGEAQRTDAQRWLAARLGADPRSVSGEHLGRLAGFKNWKRGGAWVNVLDDSLLGPRPWDPSPALSVDSDPRPSSLLLRGPTAASVDVSPSGRDWARVCRALELGDDPNEICARLIRDARARRGRDAERYARLTVSRALAHMRRKL
jgi:hypothetical protein